MSTEAMRVSLCAPFALPAPLAAEGLRPFACGGNAFAASNGFTTLSARGLRIAGCSSTRASPSVTVDMTTLTRCSRKAAAAPAPLLTWPAPLPLLICVLRALPLSMLEPCSRESNHWCRTLFTSRQVMAVHTVGRYCDAGQERDERRWRGPLTIQPVMVNGNSTQNQLGPTRARPEPIQTRSARKVVETLMMTVAYCESTSVSG